MGSRAGSRKINLNYLLTESSKNRPRTGAGKILSGLLWIPLAKDFLPETNWCDVVVESVYADNDITTARCKLAVRYFIDIVGTALVCIPNHDHGIVFPRLDGFHVTGQDG